MGFVRNADVSAKTVRAIRKWIAHTFGIPVKQVSRVIFHGIILADIIAGFWLLDSLKDPILSDTVGMEYQPYAKFISVGVTLIVVSIYDFLTSLVSKPALFHIVSFVFGTIMMVLSGFLSQPEYGFGNGRTGPRQMIGWLTYFAVEAYGSLMVALFWSFTNSLMDLEDAKGAYGLIIAIAQVGAITGSTVATHAHALGGIPQLFIIGSILIFLVSLLVKLYHIVFKDYATQANRNRVRSESESSTFESLLPSAAEHENDRLLSKDIINRDSEEVDKSSFSRRQSASSKAHAAAKQAKAEEFYSVEEQGFTECTAQCSQSLSHAASGFVEGLWLIGKYPYVLKLLGVSCLYEIVVTILDYEFKLMGSHEALEKSSGVDASDRFANLLGHFGQVTNIISFVVSFFGFSYLVHHIGVQRSLMIFPVTLFVAVIVSYLSPSLSVLFIFVSILKGMIFSLHDPVKELLYIPTSESIKFKAKAWIDVFGSRTAKAVGSLVTSLSFGSAHRLRQIAEIPAIILSLFIIVITWSIGTDFFALVESNHIVGDDLARLRYAVDDTMGPEINGLRPGDVGYSGYDPELFVGVFDEVGHAIGRNRPDEDEEEEDNVPMVFASGFGMNGVDGSVTSSRGQLGSMFEMIHRQRAEQQHQLLDFGNRSRTSTTGSI